MEQVRERKRVRENEIKGKKKLNNLVSPVPRLRKGFLTTGAEAAATGRVMLNWPAADATAGGGGGVSE